MLHENHSTRPRSMFSAAAALVLIFLLPVAAIWLLGSAVIEQMNANQSSDGEQALDRQAESICEHLDPERFFGLHFDRLYDELYADGTTVDAQRIEQLVVDFSARQLGFFPAVFVEGKLATPEKLLSEHVEPLIDAWENAHGYSSRHTYASAKYLNTLFGAPYSSSMLKSHEGRIMKFSGYRGDGYIYYRRSPQYREDSTSSPAGIYVVLWTVPPIDDLKNFLPAELTAGVNLGIQTRAATADEGRHLQIVKKRVGDRFLVITKKFSGLDPVFARTLLKIFLLVMLLLLAMLIRSSDLPTRMRSAPIRLKLVGLILYAVILPLSGLGYFGWKYISERRELLIQEAWLACHGSINEFENNFEKEKAQMLNYFRSFKEIPEMKTNPASLFQKFRQFDAENLINWVEVRDIDAEVLMTIQRRETAQQLGLIGKAVARMGINNFLGHRQTGQTVPPRASEVLVQEFLEGPFGGWARIFESPDELHEVSFGGFEIFWYWDVFDDPGARAAFIVVDQHVRWAVRNYLNSDLMNRVSFGGGGLRLFAWSNVYSQLWPPEAESPDELMRFVRQIQRSNRPQNSLIDWNGARWVAAGAPGKKLAGTLLLSLYPLDEVEREISGIRSDLAWGVLFALILAVLVGSMFSYTIIRPVANLMNGVQALRRRDTGHRLEVLQNDELGRLSATFNATSEKLADIISARTIQMQLIPEQAPALPGFNSDLAYIPAADLGGDYCDFLALPDGRWLVLIGDVTGHGVSSAMVTTMIKAVVTDYAANPEFSRSEMFACLNELLFSQFSRKKCMTLFAAVVDGVTGRVDCINAGHPLPLHFSAGKRQKFPQLCRPPLGFSTRNAVFPEATVQLAAGDHLVLYTDIFIETADKAGKPYGSDGLAQICSDYLHLSPTQMRDGIIATVKSTAAAELDDDLTLIILQRTDSVAVT